MEKEIQKFDYNQLRSQDWIESIIEDCHAIVVERRFNASMEVIEGKWEIGKRIVKDSNYQKYLKGSGKLISELAQDIGLSQSDLYDCIKIYEMFDKFSNVLETFDKTVTWFKVRQKYLGKRDEKKGTPLVCYRLEGILEAFKKWLEKSTFEDEQATNRIVKSFEINDIIEDFRKNYLIKPRK